MKPSRQKDELCYSYIYDPSHLADYEVLTDELCAQLGAAISMMPTDEPLSDLSADLERLQPLAFHLNGSIRGRLAVEEADLAWLHARYDAYKAELAREERRLFVLPRGTTPIPELHQARSNCKKALRALVRVEQEGREIPPIVPRFLNLLCNFCFILTVVINRRRGVIEPEFISKSYGMARKHDKRADAASA